MKKYLTLCVAALAMVGILTGGAQADNVKFIWFLEIPGTPAIVLDNYTMQQGETFRWQDVGIPPEYQFLAGAYWAAMGNSSITVSQDAVHQDITIKINFLQTLGMTFGYPTPIVLEFEVYDGIVGGNSVEGLPRLDPFSFDRPDGLVLYFDLSSNFEAVFLAPLGLTRQGLTLVFAVAGGFSPAGISVSATYDGLAMTSLTGEVAHLSTVVMVPEEAVATTAIKPNSWAVIKALYR